MPIFDYLCPSCNTKFEKIVKAFDSDVECPKCSTLSNKQVSTPTFIMTGKGYAPTAPKLDQDLLRLDDVSLNRELGLPDNCGL